MKAPSRSSRTACWPIPGDGLPERFPLDEQKSDSLLASLDRDLIATVEENERAIAGALADQGLAPILFGGHTEGLRARAKRPRPFDDGALTAEVSRPQAVWEPTDRPLRNRCSRCKLLLRIEV